MTVDEALLTGESHPVTRTRGETVVAGSFNLAGSALVHIDKLGRDTRFAQIVQLMEQASTEKPRLAQLADRIAAPFLVLVLLAAIVAGFYWWSIDHTKAFAVAVAVLIVTCPCALSLATPAAMLAAAGAMARRGILVRRLQAFEALSKIQAFVFDKTGTLTQDRVVLRKVITLPAHSENEALNVAWPLASQSLHPVSKAIAAAHAPQGQNPQAFVQVQEIAGQGVVLETEQGSAIKLGSAAHCGLDEADLQRQGRAFPGQPAAYLADENGWYATFLMDEGVREDAAESITQLQHMGLKTVLLTGDRSAAAQRVADQVGISQVIAQATPEGKLSEIMAMQNAGMHLAMVGDGLNDAPVLARANVSFALGHGAPLTQAQSDFVVQSGRLREVVEVVEVARHTMAVVRQNLWWAGIYNALAVPMALIGWMPPWAAGLGMAASSLLVMGNATRLARTTHPTQTSLSN